MIIILSLSIWSIFWKLSNVCITVWISLCSQPIFHWVFELTLISITLLYRQYTESFNFSVFPLSKISISLWTFPHSTSIFLTPSPLPIIHFSIRPLKSTLSLLQPSLKLPNISRTIRHILIPFTLFKIMIKISLIRPPIKIKNNSTTIFHSIFRQLPKINSIPIFLNTKILSINIANKLTFWLILRCYPIWLTFSKTYINWMYYFFCCPYEIVCICSYCDFIYFWNLDTGLDFFWGWWWGGVIFCWHFWYAWLGGFLVCLPVVGIVGFYYCECGLWSSLASFYWVIILYKHRVLGYYMFFLFISILRKPWCLGLSLIWLCLFFSLLLQRTLLFDYGQSLLLLWFNFFDSWTLPIICGRLVDNGL